MEMVLVISIVLPSKHLTALGLAALLLIPLTSCTTNSVGESLRDAFAADPQLKDNASASASPQPSPVQTASAQLPADFPAEVPLYPNRVLLEATQQPGQDNQPSQTLTRWNSPDSSDRVVSFYRQELQKNGWNLDGQPNSDTQGVFEADRNQLQLRVNVQAAGSGTGFEIQVNSSTGNLQSNSAQEAETTLPQPGSPDFIGPVAPTSPAASSQTPVATTSEGFTDLEKAPKQLQQYVKDLTQLGVLSLANNTKADAAKQNLFEPNKTITRREYARWLVAANNRIYANRPARQIRLAIDASQPAFQDVLRSDPDFAAIQGLAEAGLLPSPLSGDSTAVLFRPNAPLTREDLIRWKVPVDTRQALPTATIEAVKQTWGFQDATRIDGTALRAVLADFQNGDQANLRRAFGYTTLFQPKRPVTRAEAAAVLWYFGFQGDGLSAQDALKGGQPSSAPTPN